MPTTLMVFSEFPYVMTRVVGALYHVILLPTGWPEEGLLELARLQAFANQLPTCLALARDRAVYFGGNDDGVETQQPPLGGILASGRLVAPLDCEDGSDELRARQFRLAAAVRQSSRNVLGDVTKGGRRATPHELKHLAGALPDGTPHGLVPCATCGEWQGLCLDPSEAFAGMAMAVDCRCANNNRCARCHQLLYPYRLNANYYAPDARTIVQVPGFCGFEHRCSLAIDGRVNAA